MRLLELPEPKLEFANGQLHICPRHGIAEHDVYDAGSDTRPDRIVVAVVGSDQGIQQFSNFVSWTSGGVETDAGNARLNPSFCGMYRQAGFRTRLVTGPDVQQIISGSDIRTVKGITRFSDRVESAVRMYLERIEYISTLKRPDVVVCVIPDDLFDLIRHNTGTPDPTESEALPRQYETTRRDTNFRAMLKARALRYGVPLQIVRNQNLEQETQGGAQPAATRAWNLCTALYFKSNIAAPWKLHAEGPVYPTCFVGIAFFRSVDASSVDASTAQIFDEVGKSVILRGRPAAIASEDRAPYLSERDAHDLMQDALGTYRTAVRTTPSRLVVHKSSRFLPEEMAGFRAAADANHIDMLDLVSVGGSQLRLYREQLYPPLRGSMLELDSTKAILYTKGSVPFFRTYPGPRVPRPLDVEIFASDRSLETVCSEILGLTKMNWNNTQFDNKNPITLGCARSVGEVIKYLDESDLPQPSYAYYM